MALSTDVVDTWVLRMQRESGGLDFANDEDRATFRGRVAKAMEFLRTSGARQLANTWGVTVPGNASHEVTVRACADAWMSHAQPERPARCPKCKSNEHLTVTETYTAFHPYNPTTHHATNALGVTCPSEHFDDGNSDYGAQCHSCHHGGTLAEFGMLLVDWS